MNICMVEKDLEEIELIKPLWNQLNSVHYENSIYFKDRFKKLTFDNRIKSIYKKAQKGLIKFDMLWDGANQKYIGYCLSSIKDDIGELESIYIENQYRKFGLGKKLMESALEWFKSKQITNIEINVVYANDEALPFYERYGFYIGNYIIKRL